MSEFLQTVLYSIVAASTAIAVLTWLFKTTIGKLLEESIEHQYEKWGVEYKNQIENRQRAQLIADLLAEWMSTPIDSPMSPEQRKHLNTLSFQATLWLPEAIARDLSRVLQKFPDAPNQFDVLLRVREHLSGPHALTTKEITQWGRESELPNRGLPPGVIHGEVHVLGVSEEVNGIDREIKEGELAKGYRPLSGAVICLKYERQGKEVLAKTADIEWLKLISKREIGGSTIEMRIEIAPKSSADAINRNLFDLGLHGQKSGLALPTVSS